MVMIMDEQLALAEWPRETREMTQIRLANEITEAIFDYSALEFDLMFGILRKIKEDGPSPDHIYDLTYADFYDKELDPQKNRTRIATATKGLVGKVFEYIERDTGDFVQHAMARKARYKKGAGKVYVELNRESAELFGMVVKHTTRPFWEIGHRLSGKYSKRFYLWCSKHRVQGKFTMTISELLKKLRVNSKAYEKRWDNVQNRILKPAQAELIEKMSDVWFTYEKAWGEDKIHFTVHTSSTVGYDPRPVDAVKNDLAEKQEITTQYIFEKMEFWGLNEAQQLKVLKHFQEDGNRFFNLCRKVATKGDTFAQNKPAYVCKILRNDFGMKGKI